MMFNIGICDDEPMICTQIEEIILNHFKSKSKEIDIKIFHSGEKLWEFIENEHDFDLIFLDIEMDAINGIEVGRKIREEMDNELTQIVYISGKNKYDRQLFEIRPMHFLSKPLDESKIIKDVHLAMELIGRLSGVFTYKKGQETCRVFIKDILYFESRGRQVKIVLTKGEDLFYGKLKDIVAELSKYWFMHIHKSCIVNYAYIHKFRYESVTMTNSRELPISQSRRKGIRALQLQYERENKL